MNGSKNLMNGNFWGKMCKKSGQFILYKMNCPLKIYIQNLCAFYKSLNGLLRAFANIY